MYLWPYTAISRKVVGKSSRDNPERYLGGFEFTVPQKNLKEWHEKAGRMFARAKGKQQK